MRRDPPLGKGGNPSFCSSPASDSHACNAVFAMRVNGLYRELSFLLARQLENVSNSRFLRGDGRTTRSSVCETTQTGMSPPWLHSESSFSLEHQPSDCRAGEKANGGFEACLLGASGRLSLVDRRAEKASCRGTKHRTHESSGHVGTSAAHI
jgi:hypothetical protein